MKKLLIVMVIVLGSLGFSTSVLASQAVAENPKITSEQAKEIALKQSKNGKYNCKYFKCRLSCCSFCILIA